MKRKKSERGAALVMAIFAATLMLLLLMTMLVITQTSGLALKRQLSSEGQALNAASAGLTEGLSWFVRQQQQPVTNFNPVVDGAVCNHNPPHNPLAFDSEDAALGIVRAFEVNSVGRVWGRYEVRRSAVIDVSTRRGKPQAGTIWQLESQGMIYVRNNAAVAPDVAPNLVLARRTMRVDIQRLGLNPPANAAISATRANSVNVTQPSRVQGGAAGIGVAYPPDTGQTLGNGEISGNPAENTTTNSFAIDQVFGVTQNELLAMADIVVDDDSQLPNPLPDMSLIVVRGNATFHGQRPLQGSGILVVLGNLIANPQSNAFFSGVIWVQGNLQISPPGVINGTVIANGNAHLLGGADVAEVVYDAAILAQIRQQMGNYLFSRSPWLTGGGALAQ
jgi:Tfp pilus assembly protein PilX